MIPKTPPKWFINALYNLDSDLRVRWSYEQGKFAIERKCDKRGLYKPVKFIEDNGRIKEVLLPEHSDKYIQYHDGYAAILYTSQLNEGLLSHLREIDNWQSKKSLEDIVRENEIKRENELDKQNSEEIKAIARSTWDYYNVRGSMAQNDFK